MTWSRLSARVSASSEIRGLRYRLRVPNLDVSARSSAKKAKDDLKSAALTRDDVAKRLGVSVSTVRRLEGTKLHPLIDDNGVRRFRASDVERYAQELEAEQRTPRNAAQAVVRAAQLSRGEIAALVFERLEQRHSLAEIVIALRVPPEDVRDLYHTWLVGLWAGELQRKEPALPARHTDQDAIRRVTPVQLAQLLAALPAKQSTRISIARMLGEFVIADGPETDAGFVEYRNLSELGGFDVSGPIALADIMARVGAGEYRVSAYGFDPRGLRWEVFVRLGEEPS
ncbi:MAG: helix-turn-helix domain-containing protein [Deltaproteobacteria bacterium]|nr:helix-turn-helix domain-containing protein [Deltaproteobacteria bacterium]